MKPDDSLRESLLRVGTRLTVFGSTFMLMTFGLAQFDVLGLASQDMPDTYRRMVESLPMLGLFIMVGGMACLSGRYFLDRRRGSNER